MNFKRKKVVFIILASMIISSVSSGCFTTSGANAYDFLFPNLEKQPKQILIVSESEQYGIWFDKYAKVDLVAEDYFGLIAESGLSNGGGMKALNWVERDYGNGKNEIISTVVNTDYNQHVQNFNRYDAANIANGSWDNVEYLRGSGEVLSVVEEPMETYTVYHILSTHKYSVQKGATFDRSMAGKEVYRKFYHLIVAKQGRGFLEFFRPDDRSLPATSIEAIDRSASPKNDILINYFDEKVEISEKEL